jgi:hypothetical protein
MRHQSISIPEKLGFKPISFARKKKFSFISYQTQYYLYEDEAEEVWHSHTSHPEIDLTLSLRYAEKGEYYERVNAAAREALEGGVDDSPLSEEEESYVNRLTRKTTQDVKPFTDTLEDLRDNGGADEESE